MFNDTLALSLPGFTGPSFSGITAAISGTYEVCSHPETLNPHPDHPPLNSTPQILTFTPSILTLNPDPYTLNLNTRP